MCCANSRPYPLPLQYYPEYRAVIERLDSMIKRADALRYFIMHAVGGEWGVGAIAMFACTRCGVDTSSQGWPPPWAGPPPQTPVLD